MKRSRSTSPLITGVFLVLFFLPVLAQDSTSSQPFFAEVSPRTGEPGIYDLIVPLEMLDKAQEDLADLRLFNAQGREIPYALRIRKELDEKRDVEARVFNQARLGGTTSEMSVDLGEHPGEHNEVEIETAGSNFRRRVEVEGGDSTKEWRTLKTGDVIFSFGSQNKTVESKRIGYPASRYRYLRVRIFPDELSDKQAPAISGVKVMMSLREKGQFTTWPVPVPAYQFLRNNSSPASAWTIDLGARVPCDRLLLEVADESFSRPFQVETADESQNVRLVASGELTRRVGEPLHPMTIAFDTEVYARKLRLLITDYSNQTLSIATFTAAAPERQIVFELKEGATQPLRLYCGDPKASAPHYDFEKDLQSKVSDLTGQYAQPTRCEVGALAENPGYTPEPLPLTERIPWLIYVVLTVSSIALAIILVGLARTALRSEEKRSNTESDGGTIGIA